VPRKSVASFQVEYLQVLDENGTVDKKLEPKVSPEDLKRLYRCMVLGRMTDERMYKLQAQGRMGTFPGVRGQEAVVGCVHPLKMTDWLVPAFRETSALFWRGISPKRVMQYFAGMEEGNLFPKESRTLPYAITVGSQTLHAAGMAWAARIRGDDSVVLVFFGDGGTSLGDFHEACNMAGIHKLPVVFVCQNNQYAISVPRSMQSGSPTLAQKAIGYGFNGVQIDGNDFLSGIVAARDAVDRARKGEGPTFIECLTYRLGPHTTADDARRYRTDEEVKYWTPRDPLLRARKYLEAKGIWNQAAQTALEEELTAEIEAAVKEYETELHKLDPLLMFDNIYAEPTPEIVAQRKIAAEFLAQGAGAGHGKH
jgi:pyruvate dehydrogenase E1 component alpha subunit